MYTNIFEGCNNSIGGVEKLYIVNANTINDFDVIYSSNYDNTIMLNIDEENNTMYSADSNQPLSYREVYPNMVDAWQDIEKTRQGIVYRKRVSFEIPKASLLVNNQIRDFLFNSNGRFAISKTMFIIKDSNKNNWLMGFDNFLELQEFDIKTNNNSYAFVYSGYGYYPAYKYEL